MRKKAEKKIREAVIQIGSKSRHRLDLVRRKAGLHPKIFDKTILDMERVGTIKLYSETTNGMTRGQISALVRRGDVVYTSFSFIETRQTLKPKPEPEAFILPCCENKIKPATIETIVVILQNLIPGEWEKFTELCESIEGQKPHEKIENMIREYIYCKKK